MAVVAVPAQSSGAASADGAHVTTISMSAPAPYTPHAASGGTDDYHCTLVDPHVNQNSFIVSSQFSPGTGSAAREVHHEITFLVPPSVTAEVKTLNKSGKGWTCFGESPLPALSLASLTATPWLSAWAPGHGKDVLPASTGTPLPAHSLVIMQVHYNLLQGDKPVKVGVKLNTVPASTHLRPLTLTPYPAPDQHAVPGGRGGRPGGPPAVRTRRLAAVPVQALRHRAPWCSRTSSSSSAGRTSPTPPEGNSVTCTQYIRQPGYIVRTTAHMHLLGRSMTMVVDPGTPQAKTILNVPKYDFNYQKSYDLKHWVKVQPGDKVQFTCTYDPTLASELPALRKAPAHFVTWGDGSSDEMCLGLIQTVPVDPHATVNWSAIGTHGGHRHPSGATPTTGA